MNKCDSAASRINATMLMNLDAHRKTTTCRRIDKRGRQLADHAIAGDRESPKQLLREAVRGRRPHFALDTCGGLGWVHPPP